MAVRIVSKLVAQGRLAAFIDFPYADRREGGESVGRLGQQRPAPNAFYRERQSPGDSAPIDATAYHVAVAGAGGLVFQPPTPNPPAKALLILSARYGAKTATPMSRQRSPRRWSTTGFEIDVNNDLSGDDPILGTFKHLRVRYKLAGQPFEERIPEGGKLVLGGRTVRRTGSAGRRRRATSWSSPASSLPTRRRRPCRASPRPWPPPRRLGRGSGNRAGRSTCPPARTRGGSNSSGAIVLSQYLLAVNEAGSAASGERAGQQRLERQVPHGDVLVARGPLRAVEPLGPVGA